MRTAIKSIESSPLLFNFTTPKQYIEEKEKYKFVYDPINQVTYYMDEDGGATQSKRTNNEYDGSRGSEDRMRYFDDD